MARDRKTIKKEMTDAFIGNAEIQSLYGLTVGNTFEQEFSLVSLENILFEIISFCVWTHEVIVDQNAQNSRPQNLPNFRAAVLGFLDGLELVWKDGAFSYDTTGVTDVEERKIIDRCAVLESDDGELVVKIATDNGGNLEPVTEPQKVRVLAYLKQIKVPGVKIRLINETADLLKTNLTVYVDPMIIDMTTGKLLNTSEEIYPVKVAIENYLANLEFNGAFVKEYFRSEISKADGVKLPVVDLLQWRYADLPFVDVGEWQTSNAGYFKILEENLTINYLPNVLVNG